MSENIISEKDWAIVTNSKEKAEMIINTILTMCDPGTVEKRAISKDSMTVVFSDGTKIQWYKALINYIRGMKCSRLWCDKYADMDLLEYIKICYFGEDKDIIWI